MKILKYLFFIVLALVLIALAIGLLKPTINYGHKISVNKSVKEAWAVHQDETKLSQWLKGFKSIEQLSGEKGAVGSKYKVVVNPGEGQENFEMIETIVSKKDYDYIEFSFDSDMAIFGQTTTFSEKDGKTTLQTASTINGKGIIMRSMMGVMGLFGSFQKQEVENIENLKKVIENNTTNYFPTPSADEPVIGSELD